MEEDTTPHRDDQSNENIIIQCSGSNNQKEKERSTRVVRAKDGFEYVLCNQRQPFAYKDWTTTTASEVNAASDLRLHLGLLSPHVSAVLRRYLTPLLRLLLVPYDLVETFLYRVWHLVPVQWRHVVLMKWLWVLYQKVHALVLGRCTGVHRSLSPQYHALTTLCYAARFFPLTLARMRFCLNEVVNIHPPSWLLSSNNQFTQCKVTTEVTTTMTSSTTTTNNNNQTHKNQKLVGYHLQLDASKRKPRAIFWYFGGGFVGGSCESNLGMAERVGRECNADVFLANHRRLPDECGVEEVLEDAEFSYRYFVETYGNSYPCSRVIMLGLSSGGGLVAHLIQNLPNEKQPAGAVLIGPFVDFTDQSVSTPTGSFMAHSTAHDLVVSAAAYEFCVPLMKTCASDSTRRRLSPLHSSFPTITSQTKTSNSNSSSNEETTKLPKLCVVVSRHEVVYDQNVQLVNRAREAGLDCTFAVFEYLGHVFPIFSGFDVPEAHEAWKVIYRWMHQTYVEAETETKENDPVGG